MNTPVPSKFQPQANYMKSQYEIYIKKLTGLNPRVTAKEAGLEFHFEINLPVEIPFIIVQRLAFRHLEAVATDEEDLKTVLEAFKTQLVKSRPDIQLNPGM
ncbi:hypothetical protein SAMN04487996_12267 [Dyadobacter soli]|uniref:Uncharacterized protein n=1 Tax=Dyadobacter soli TaxID=659014 RepID=A0A1G7WJ63_9BACT|nr:hypothetical protein [Dyadobacter soli]SDG72005.1 hypothetical protein SAMN04487996_12267 [Dyadobacter soli]